MARLCTLLAAFCSGVEALSGSYTGRVPGIIKITLDFSDDTVNSFISVIGQQDISCPSELYSATDTQVTFTSIAEAGDCFGDALRGQGKDTSKYTLDINSDGSLTFHSDGYPNMKMTKDTLSEAAISGSYTGRVPGIIKITMDFDGDSTVNAFISVIGQQDISCPTESYAVTDGSIGFTNIAVEGDCFGDALRGQGKDTSKYTLDINSDGTLTFHSDGYPNMKMTKDSLASEVAISGSYTGRVPGIIKITMDFDGDSTVNAFISVIGQQDISCPTESYAVTDGSIGFTNIAVEGDCFGDALRGQGKDTSKYTLDINSDGTLTFHSDGYPNMKMTKDSLTSEVAISGSYTGRVPGIIKITMDFDGDSTVNAFISVIGQQDISCPTESYAVTDGSIGFTNIAVEGDCFGDALRGQGKDTSKYTLDINSDGTLTFHSDGYPNMKMTKDTLAAAVSGSYTGRVVGIIKITMDFQTDSMVNAFISVIGQQDISCPTESYTVSGSSISFTNIADAGDCFGDALRGQGKDTSKYTLDINSDGTLTFHSDGYPDMKMKKDSSVFLA